MIAYSPLLSSLPNLKHAFFGIGSDSYVTQRDQAMKTMAGKPLPLVTLKQVHGTKVLHITDSSQNNQEGDGLVTTSRELALGILTADCGPILFYDPFAQIIGACHAGWRGEKGGIIQETIKTMEKLGALPSQISATLGPTIQQHHYEVGPEFPDLIGEPYEKYFYPSEKPGHHYFNLPLYICEILIKEGVTKIDNLGMDTFSGNFVSRRRLLSQGIDRISADNLSAIAMT